jgi:trans-aconitate methyltransferase
MDTFKKIVKDAFVQQANEQGEVELIFNRIFLVAIKE